MLIPLSWLKEYVEIKLPLEELMWKMTEAGLTCESFQKSGSEITLDVEVTANRPDWMSIIGVAREIAAIQNVKIKEPNINKLPKQTANFPLDIETNFDLIERWSALIIKDVQIKPSPDWLQVKIKLMGHAPINNIIDVTNYVMYEYGIPMHAFDYDQIRGQIMTLTQADGGEEFKTVDGETYKLPRDAMIIRDADRIIDLVGIKGGLNSGINQGTKNVLLHVTIDNPALIRRTSIAMGLRSEASAIYERGPDKGGTLKSLYRAVNLILGLGGGEIASKVIDLSKKSYKSKELYLAFAKLDKILGISLHHDEVFQILAKLNLYPKKRKDGIKCQIPTYRADIQIEEDLVEEVARLYGYNKFPATLPVGRTADKAIPYFFDDTLSLQIKDIFISLGYTEAKTLSLVSAENITQFLLNKDNHFRITNPVSLDYEFLRQSLVPGLVYALKINNEKKIALFDIDKVYRKTGDGSSREAYKLAAVCLGHSFREFKSAIDLIVSRLNISDFKIDFECKSPFMHQSMAGTLKSGNLAIGEFGALNPSILASLGIEDQVFCLEFDVACLSSLIQHRKFKPISSNPAQVEDLTFVFPPKTRIGEVMCSVKSVSPFVEKVELKDIYNDAFTFTLWYQNPEKSLSNLEAKAVREKIQAEIKTKFGGSLKE
jgi:phenylalanyl-tRNA synthetase beta chain